MVLPAVPDVDRMKRRIQSPDYRDWRKKVEDIYGCLHPVRLTGLWEIADKTSGEVLKSTGGHIFAPCGNRRESVCPACSDRYAADAFHLLRAGLSGGSKGIPVEVADKPRLFVTLTAPSFGPVHNRRTRHGKLLPCRCGRYHHEHDPLIGQPVDPESYDYVRHVLWQAHSGKLWNLFTKALRRQIARAAGITVREFGAHARLSYAKVAEFQRRGVIHFHAVIRLDGPDGAVDTTPAWGTTELLADAVRAAHAVTEVTMKTFTIDGAPVRFTWGDQVDVRPIRAADAHQVEEADGTISDDRIASYVAKYATKGTGKSGSADRPIRSRAQIERLATTEHHREIMRTAWDLGAPVVCPDCHPHGPHQVDGCGCAGIDHCATCGNGGYIPGPLDGLNLRRWCHMLAFRGHFLSKSRGYSTTFKRLREDRQIWRFEQNLADLGRSADTVTVINHWDMTSVGHRSDEERELAAAIAERTRAARKHRYQTERKD
ncbi:replication initiation protein [Saccharopolyspora subtropica]|uniref:Replication initiation protein n=1 Tax=Saccharopolyspora thermophila TaxID=89367 RepID=A0A917JRS1_9PSEU|nr:replication initiator [Saccharopolyspora subtropica]GGI81386.1 replication initiation protein [Saccharopolyspora subtropica]